MNVCDRLQSQGFIDTRYLWRGKHTFAIAQHKHHRSIYEEADSNKRRKRYARPLIDLHMKIYCYEGMEQWNPKKGTISGKMTNFTFYFVGYYLVSILVKITKVLLLIPLVCFTDKKQNLNIHLSFS